VFCTFFYYVLPQRHKNCKFHKEFLVFLSAFDSLWQGLKMPVGMPMK
jgi:hypothetical protein